MTLPRTLHRVVRMPVPELRMRLEQAGRIALQRAMVRLREPRWDRRRLAPALDAGIVPPHVTRALRRGAWLDAHAALVDHTRTRPRRFVLSPADRDDLRTAVTAADASAADDAAARGERIARGAYDLLGYTALRFSTIPGTAPDWHFDPVSGRRAPRIFSADVPYLDPACGDHKVTWELNRHQHWLVLARADWLTDRLDFRRAWLSELESWLDANPPLVGINWASALELALRCLSWLWALHLFSDRAVDGEPPWSVDLLLGLDRQLAHIEATASYYFSPNTHLLGEGLALYVCGQALPELARSTPRATTGRRILIAEAARQVLKDGGHAELSPHYHRYALDFYLLALSLARVTGDDETARALEPVVDRMAMWLCHIADDRQRLPLIGDDDGGELFPIAGLRPSDASVSLAWAARVLGRPDLFTGVAPEPVTWLTWDARTRRPCTTGDTVAAGCSVVLTASGYVVLKHGRSQLVFDCGHHGFLNGGHAHADALSLTLVAGGEPLLVDPGTGTYTMDALVRDRFRSTPLHNTVVLDGRSQAEPSGPFHWHAAPRATVSRTVLAPSFGYACGRTDAWDPVVHERHVLMMDDDTWLVADRVLGSDAREVTAHWHVPPAWTPRRPRHGAVGVSHGRGLHATLATDGEHVEVLSGDRESGLGWIAPVYGRIEPAHTVRATTHGTLPVWLTTAITVSQAASDARLVRLEVQATEPAGASLAVSHRREGRHLVFLLRGAKSRDTATVLVDPRGAAITTDARVFCAEFTATGTLDRLCLVDATLARVDGDRPLTIHAPQGISDLFVRFEDAEPTLETTAAGAGVSVELDPAHPRVPAGLSEGRPNGPRPLTVS